MLPTLLRRYWRMGPLEVLVFGSVLVDIATHSYFYGAINGGSKPTNMFAGF